MLGICHVEDLYVVCVEVIMKVSLNSMKCEVYVIII
jgi:hypothetical protein